MHNRFQLWQSESGQWINFQQNFPLIALSLWKFNFLCFLFIHSKNIKIEKWNLAKKCNDSLEPNFNNFSVSSFSLFIDFLKRLFNFKLLEHLILFATFSVLFDLHYCFSYKSLLLNNELNVIMGWSTLNFVLYVIGRLCFHFTVSWLCWWCWVWWSCWSCWRWVWSSWWSRCWSIAYWLTWNWGNWWLTREQEIWWTLCWWCWWRITKINKNKNKMSMRTIKVICYTNL